MRVRFAFDPVKGGFDLRFGDGAVSGARWSTILNGIMEVLVSPGPRVHRIRSVWGAGGLPVRGLFRQPHVAGAVRGDHFIAPPAGSLGPLQVWQHSDRFVLWFSPGKDLPKANWTALADEEVAVGVWLSTQRVHLAGVAPKAFSSGDVPLLAGIGILADRLPEPLPVEMLQVVSEEIAG